MILLASKPSRPVPSRNTARDQVIVLDRALGRSVREISTDYSLTKARVVQILRRIERRGY